MFSFANNSENINKAYPDVKETLPKSYLGYDTNTQFPAFPPKMSDGRSLISSWQPESIINDNLIKQNNIESNWMYRKYLTENAKKIMEYNFRESCNDTGYIIPPYDDKSDKNSPHMFKSFNDQSKPNGYQDSDLKQMYLTREQLNSKKVSPVVTQEQLLRSNNN